MAAGTNRASRTAVMSLLTFTVPGSKVKDGNAAGKLHIQLFPWKVKGGERTEGKRVWDERRARKAALQINN